MLFETGVTLARLREILVVYLVYQKRLRLDKGEITEIFVKSGEFLGVYTSFVSYVAQKLTQNKNKLINTHLLTHRPTITQFLS